MEHGDSGAAVGLWQAVLEVDGLDITDKVGTFGDTTHNGTMDWQKGRGREAAPEPRDEAGRCADWILHEWQAYAR